MTDRIAHLRRSHHSPTIDSDVANDRSSTQIPAQRAGFAALWPWEAAIGNADLNRWAVVSEIRPFWLSGTKGGFLGERGKSAAKYRTDTKTAT
ncbi:hypothetical protein ACFL5Q_05420 [Planctomycetota bacterium]